MKNGEIVGCQSNRINITLSEYGNKNCGLSSIRKNGG
jgi:hypothetical protein